MPPKPVDKRRPDATREALWKAIRTLQTFTVRDLWGETCLSKDTVRDYVAGLQAAGYIQRLPADDPLFPGYLKLVRDNGVEAPRVRRDGTEITQGRGRENMWRTMRILGEFSAVDLAVHATTEDHHVAVSEAKDYCGHLHRAGYLVAARGGKGGILTRYRFLPTKYTGPRPPMIQRIKQVFDPNLNKVVWSGGDDDGN